MLNNRDALITIALLEVDVIVVVAVDVTIFRVVVFVVVGRGLVSATVVFGVGIFVVVAIGGRWQSLKKGLGHQQK